MPNRYFEKFPLTTYANAQVVDITKRSALLERVSANPYVFYPYDIGTSERPDQLAARYYNDPYNSWILYVANKIVDPYYEWYLTEDEINEFIEKKYGSLHSAQSKTMHYKNAWFDQQEMITPSEFQSLPIAMQKYWEPNYGAGSSIINYTRKEIDWMVNTNKLVSYSVESTKTFIVDEICEIVFDASNVGRGQVAGISNGNLIIQHVSGTFYPSEVAAINPNSHIRGLESEASTKFNSVSIIANNIPDAEIVYWTPVSYYDFEVERNEYNRSIRVVDFDLKEVMADNLRELMKE